MGNARSDVSLPIGSTGRLKQLSTRVDLYLVAALLVGFIVRVWQFGEIPPGLNQDEASTAYDAFSILNYGVDRNGSHNPVVLISWGSGMYSLASYLEMPFIAIFGLSVTAARMVFLLAGLASLPIFYYLLRDAIDLRTARIGVALLAISPWHIMNSRWGLDSSMFPLVFLAGVYLLVRSFRNERWLTPAFAVIALSLYGYGTGYVAVPVFLALCLGYGLWFKTWSWKAVVFAVLTFAVVALPIALYVLINTFHWNTITTPFFTIPRLTGVPRYQTMSNLDIAGNLANATKLMITQNDGLIWQAIPPFGFMYRFTSILAVFGLGLLCYRIYTNRSTFHASFVIVAWSAAGIVLCTFLYVNINRANIVMFPFIACTAVAVSYLWKYRVAAAALAAAFAIAFIAFLANYFGPYRNTAASAFYTSLGDAITYAAAQTQGQICVTGDVNMPYIFVLFYTKADPRTFSSTVQYDNPGAEFQQVASFDRYTFGLNRCPADTQAVIATKTEAQQINEPGFARKDFELYSVFTRNGGA